MLPHPSMAVNAFWQHSEGRKKNIYIKAIPLFITVCTILTTYTTISFIQLQIWTSPLF